jgi:outer membrane receptor for ferrienterochelin and colicins
MNLKTARRRRERNRTRPSSRHIGIGCLLAGLQAAASAQAPPAPAPAASQPAPATQSIEVTGRRDDDDAARRQSTAAKIVVGRGEIERYGDTSLGDLFKRLPGVTIQGTPRRGGGSVRMRGLGSGYTQILLDGERVPSGFSIDSISPEQIERIEILRAPTAETGTRAIAGTINIITREGSTKRSEELRLALGYESNRLQPGFNWTRSDRAGNLAYNWTLGLQDEFAPRDIDSVSTVVDQRLDNGATEFAQRETSHTHERRNRFNLGGRLQWRDEQGDGLTLTPLLTHTTTRTDRYAELVQSAGATPALYDDTTSDGRSRNNQLRLGARWRQTLNDDTQLELRGSARESRGTSSSVREEFDANDVRLRRVDDQARTRERSLGAGAKLSRDLGETHQLAAGVEAEAARRSDARATLQDGAPLLLDFGDELQARSTRWALYAQDEWTMTPQWTLQGGLRVESITTRGDAGGADGTTTPANRSRVASPLLHLLYKPGASNQWRLGLTRSYRSPSLQTLLARPALSSRFPVSGPNLPTAPDRVGNPALKPELATGIDLSYEHYLAGGGVIGASVFHRRLRDVIRTLTTLQTVPWSASPRWVSAPGNVGNARTSGLELEAKGRLDSYWPDAPRIGFNANASFFRSRVDGVPGPNNRLDEQPGSSLNLGLDYRLRSLPLAVGASWNRVPSYETRLSGTQLAFQGRKSVLDAYALWTFSDALRLRLSVSNAAPIDAESGGSIDTDTFRETSRSITRTDRSWQLRLEWKL